MIEVGQRVQIVYSEAPEFGERGRVIAVDGMNQVVLDNPKYQLPVWWFDDDLEVLHESGRQSKTG